MAGNSFGTLFRITTYGESHGEALGVIVDGFPANVEIDLDFIQSEMNRRRPGSTNLGTKRDEKDKVRILSGVFEGKSTGCPIHMMIENETQLSRDYSNIKDIFRPGHADYTYYEKYGNRDYRGGGRSSGRETSCRVMAGSLAKIYLRSLGISITAGAVEVSGVKASFRKWNPPFENDLCCPDKNKYPLMAQKIKEAANNLDSVGGIIECHISGVPAGLGEPCFDKLEAELGKAILSIGACKGFEIGDGFASAKSKGSENNDQMLIKDGKPSFATNHAGGILGGISNGNEIIFRAAFKPTPSISQEQKTVNIEGKEETIQIKGRHDPCIIPRAIVVVEAMAAITLLDNLLKWRAYR